MDAAGAGEAEPSAKRARVEAGAAASGGDDPRTIVVLNVNGLASRLLPKDRDNASDAECRDAAAHAAAMVTHLFGVAGAPPDVVCLTEVHLKARSAAARSELEPLDARLVADRRQAEKAHAAVDTLLSSPELRGFTPLWSLHAAKRTDGVCVLLRPGLLRALAAPPRFSLDLDAPPERHNDQGRVVALEFATTRLLLTYTPNSGKTAESLARRAAFDEQLLRFVGVQHAKPLIWCGDLNVAPDSLLDLAPSADRFLAADVAGCRSDEQQRFRDILAAGDLRDAWRQLHPGVRGGMTWRGAQYLPGLSMRLDHFVVSSALMSRVEACDVAAPPEEEARREDAETRGPRRTHPNHYFGSDHWPLWIRLRA